MPLLGFSYLADGNRLVSKHLNDSKRKKLIGLNKKRINPFIYESKHLVY